MTTFPNEIRESLTIERLDHRAALVFAGEASDQTEFTAVELCAYMEWHWLRAAGVSLGTLWKPGPFRELHDRLRSGAEMWISPGSPPRGFIRIRRRHAEFTDTSWIRYRYEFQRAAIAGGFSEEWAKEIAGAMGELEDNIHWHSDNPKSGVLVFWVEHSALEFVVLDRGIGVLASFRKGSSFEGIADHGSALMLAVQDGKSRYGTGTGRGWGFHELFNGLANSSGRMRFRSGDHLLTVDGQGGLPGARLQQCAAGNGLLVSVRVPATRG